MSQFKLPVISWKKGAIILGVLVVIIFVLSGSTNQRVSQSSTDSSGGGVSSYGAPMMSATSPYGGGEGSYEKGMAYPDAERGVAELSIASMPPVPGPDNAPAGEEKVIKSASLELTVANVDNAAKEINALRLRVGGQIGNSNFREYSSGSRSGEITIWVPSARFDEAMAELKRLALRVDNESIAASDVSAQFVDLEARLKTLRAAEEQYLEIMKRSGKLSDVLDVTRELSNTRTQIEQIEGRRDYLSRQVALSSISITLTQEASPSDLSDEWRPLAVLKAAAKETLAGLTDFLDDVLVLLVALPLLLLKFAFYGGILWLLWRGGRAIYVRLQKGALPPAA
ncbi:MAG: hypothetical protein A3D65_02790 [Candidatus Lloydbacteria bacterium RIFCSPHIGHO2_02_FULL_50_13]|uniref:DUF4349 domain-containing protein n=1 Tax=Candidatus Lloydbacteria bacterium RIFCSPHIGHO2_02_FULL_50_13 TaxID=1798661 RepID=A0A1G2D3U8_9BACT|nr:MAG: hypothetical protein A3D65_02790 [Candidatus Lloydbacteria bacterium RIFCSPHIGHO2_02_FULL_50_13]